MGLIRRIEIWLCNRELNSKLEKMEATENILDIIEFKDYCNAYRKQYPEIVDKYDKAFEEWRLERQQRL